MRALREQQQAFVRAVYGAAPNDAELAIRGTGLSAAQRLRIYRNNHLIGLRAALAAVYPVLHKLVGDDFFRHLALRYLAAHPPVSGNIHDVGAAMATFVASLPKTQTLPYLPDVARLEWAYHRVFHTRTIDAFDPAILASLNPEQLETLRFALTPACRLVQSAYPVLAIWNANQPGADGCVDLAAGACRVLVVRRDRAMEFHELSAGAGALIGALIRQQTFMQACAAVHDDTDVGALLHYLIEQRVIGAATC